MDWSPIFRAIVPCTIKKKEKEMDNNFKIIFFGMSRSMFIKIAHQLTSRKKFGQSCACVLYFSQNNNEINTTPYGAWFCIIPDFSHRRVFE